MPENDKLKFSQLAEITRAQMAGSDYAVGYKANGDNKKWTFENQADFLLNDSDAGQEFQETFVKVQDTEPSDENNRIWVKETPEDEVEVPTYDEFEAVADDVEELKGALYSDEVFNVADWENGAIVASTGTNTNNSSRIRTKGYLPWGTKKLHSTDTNVRFLVYAYNSSGTYVGGWWNDGTFNPTDVKGVTEVDFTQFYKNPTYATYQYRACIYLKSGSARVETISGILIDNISITDYLTEKPTMSLTRVPVIPTGTDFDTLTTAGEWWVENYSQISSHSNTPPGVATGGRLWVVSDNSNLYPSQIWVSYNGSREPEIWMRRYVTSWQKWSKIATGAVQPVNLRVLGYNIGAFNWGRDGGLSEDVTEKIANYKKFFGSVNPDIMLFAELSTNIDSNGSYTSDVTLMSSLFKTRVNFHQSAADTNLTNAQKVEGDGGVYLRNNNNDYAGSVGRLVCDIGNKKLLMSGGFLRVLSTAQDRLEAFQNYMSAISSYDYSIIYLDTNVLDETERQSIYSAATSAGYTVCNGGYFGLHDTYLGTPASPTTMYKQIDNIFVKGNIKVKNFYVASDEYDNLSSDHLPIIADLTLY